MRSKSPVASSQKMSTPPKYIYLNNAPSSMSIVSRQNSMLEPITETEVLLEKSIITDVVMEEEDEEGVEGGQMESASAWWRYSEILNAVFYYFETYKK